ncbi:MAG: hypothetical protein RBR77_15620 [Thauera sp.]|nr:hypothetical protein [Thauera sp.]
MWLGESDEKLLQKLRKQLSAGLGRRVSRSEVLRACLHLLPQAGNGVLAQVVTQLPGLDKGGRKRGKK